MAISLAVLASVLLLGGCCTGISLEDREKRSSHDCYGDLGCFSNEFPFNNTDGALPLDPNFINPGFLLFTGRNRHFPHHLRLNDRNNTQTSGFDANLPTKFIIHGFTQNGNVAWSWEMMRELLRQERMNVIIVDWGRGSGFPYTQAVANTRVVGAQVAAMIAYLSSATGSANSQYHLIGHSLGAHVCGYAGKRLRGLGRITGLDPAQPNFKDTEPEVRLDPSDANFVDVIHTDGSEFDTISGYGMKAPCGDIDFYPNGGSNQPGCPRETWTNVVEQLDLGPNDVGTMLACSHGRSIQLFTESINSRCSMKGYSCHTYQSFQSGECFTCGNNPCPTLGYHSNRFRSRGKFYLATAASPPYCGYHYHVSVQFGPSMAYDHGELHLKLLGTTRQSETFLIHSADLNSGSDEGFHPNQTREIMFVSHTDLGNILHVEAKFEEHGNSLISYFWTGQVSLVKIIVTDGKTDRRYYFCVRETVLQSGQTVGFDHPFRTPADCANAGNTQVITL